MVYRSYCNRICLVCLFVLAGLLAGCFEYDEKIVMNPDGSGALFIHYETADDMKFQNLYFPIDKYEIEYNIKKNYENEGISEKGHSVLQKENMTNVYMDFQFQDLAALNAAPRFQNEEFSFSRNNGNVTLQRFLYFDESKLDKTKLLFKAGIKSIFDKGVLNEIHFRFQWIVPGEIVESNATLLGDKNRAIWTTTLAEILAARSTQFYLTYRPQAMENRP